VRRARPASWSCIGLVDGTDGGDSRDVEVPADGVVNRAVARGQAHDRRSERQQLGPGVEVVEGDDPLRSGWHLDRAAGHVDEAAGHRFVGCGRAGGRPVLVAPARGEHAEGGASDDQLPPGEVVIDVEGD
jgi:hypothetical protein